MGSNDEEKKKEEPKKEEPKKEEPKKEEPKKEEPPPPPPKKEEPPPPPPPKVEPAPTKPEFPTYEGARPMPSTKDTSADKNISAPVNESTAEEPLAAPPKP